MLTMCLQAGEQEKDRDEELLHDLEQVEDSALEHVNVTNG